MDHLISALEVGEKPTLVDFRRKAFADGNRDLSASLLIQIERFNGTYPHETLDANRFDDLDEAKEITNRWIHRYNHQRTHSAIGHLPPLVFKQQWQQRQKSLLKVGSV